MTSQRDRTDTLIPPSSICPAPERPLSPPSHPPGKILGRDDEGVGAVAAMEAVLSFTGAPDDPVIAFAGHDEVTARPAQQRVLATGALLTVAPAAAIQEVVLVAAS